MSSRLYLAQLQEASSQSKNNSTECPQYSSTGSITVTSQRADNADVKRMRKQYQIKIIELENQVKFLKEEVTFIKETHQRELLNVKAVMEYEYTTKMRAFKKSLREQFTKQLHLNSALTDRNKNLEQELRLMKLKFQRADKYCKQLEETSKVKLERENREIEELKKLSTSSLNALKKQLTKDHEIQLNFTKSTFQKQKTSLNEEIEKLKTDNDNLKQEISKLKGDLTNNMVEKQEIKIQKDKQIRELGARIQVLRETSVLDEVFAKRKIRQSKLTQVSTNCQQNFDRKKLYETIEVFSSNNQIRKTMDQQLRKLWQTQVVSSKPQIRKVNTKKNCKRTSTSISTYQRQNSVADSPRFGTQAPSKCSLFFD